MPTLKLGDGTQNLCVRFTGKGSSRSEGLAGSPKSAVVHQFLRRSGGAARQGFPVYPMSSGTLTLVSIRSPPGVVAWGVAGNLFAEPAHRTAAGLSKSVRSVGNCGRGNGFVIGLLGLRRGPCWISSPCRIGRSL